MQAVKDTDEETVVKKLKRRQKIWRLRPKERVSERRFKNGRESLGRAEIRTDMNVALAKAVDFKTSAALVLWKKRGNHDDDV